MKINGEKSAKNFVKKDDKDTVDKGSAYTPKELERVTRKCVIIENAVGMKTVHLDKIGSEVKDVDSQKECFWMRKLKVLKRSTRN